MTTTDHGYTISSPIELKTLKCGRNNRIADRLKTVYTPKTAFAGGILNVYTKFG